MESLLELLHTVTENCLKYRQNPWEIPVTVLVFGKVAEKMLTVLLNHEPFLDVLKRLNLTPFFQGSSQQLLATSVYLAGE